MNLRKIAFDQEGKVRSIIKLLIFIFLFQLIGIVLIKLFVPLFIGSEFYLSFLVNVLSFIAALIALIIYAKYIDKSSLAKFGLNLYPLFFKQFTIGLLLSGVILFIVLGLQLDTLSMTFSPDTNFSYPLPLVYLTQFVRYLFGSFFEELLATAFIFTLTFEAIKPSASFYSKRCHIAIAISAIVFGLIHGMNANATFFGVLNLSLFGAITTATFAKTKSLGFAVGFHAMWNFIQNVVLGLPNSGKAAEAWIFKTSLQSSDLLSGGQFGIEGSIFLTLVLVVLLMRVISQWNSATFLSD